MHAPTLDPWARSAAGRACPFRSCASYLATCQTRGLARLEAARAETAAPRSLANGAKLLDEHPGLARLRLVQALPYGSKLELSVGADAPSE